ncbi:LptF/LptG family permease [Schleiferia thermophila]|uniref:Lipopolysaccharide export system permease protein n=1 Tax=Schleiferia thermophila TaxID=884107 RepID=A0A369AC72_9FLAO|nr:LptF/LptG family permease [Schleiferia thermophila]RCX05014.1 lipopolysaccharide export system permease protein [Schleiferia thermophila]GCD79468.1 membrane protein [Schleiferia thermophila]
MKILDRYILKLFLRPFAIVFVVMVLFLLMQWVWKYIDDLVGKGVEWYYIAELLLYFAAQMVPQAIPLSVLLASLMVFGDLGEHMELAALKSAGISLYRMMFPLFWAVTAIAVISFLFNNYVIPVTNLKGETLLRNIASKKPALNIKPGVFYAGIDGFNIKVGEKYGEDKSKLKNIIIYDHTDRLGNIKVISAANGEMRVTPDKQFLEITLYNGYSYEEIQARKRSELERRPFARSSFDKSILRLDLSSFESGDLKRQTGKDFSMLTINQLTVAADSIRKVFDKRINELNGAMLERITTHNENAVIAAQMGFTTDYENSPQDTAALIPEDMLHGLNSEQRSVVLENALRLARSHKSYFDQARLEFHWWRKVIARYHIEKHKKLALAYLAFIMFFTGTALGAIIRKGGLGMPVVISVCTFIVYHVTSFTIEKLGREIVLEPWFSIWLPSLIFTPLAVFLVYKSATDSAIMQWETWQKLIKPLQYLKKINIKYHESPAADQ